MARTIGSLENEAFKAENKTAYIERILGRLGNGEDWEYRGECLDAGKSPAYCVCGHPIRWQFVIHRTNNGTDTAIVGSECVQHFMFLNPKLYNSLATAVEELRAKIAEEKKKIKEALIEEETSILKEEYSSVYSEVNDFMDNLDKKWEGIHWWGYDDYAARSLASNFLSKNPLECNKIYKHKSGIKNYYKNAIKNGKKFLEWGNKVLSTPVPPSMEAKRRNF